MTANPNCLNVYPHLVRSEGGSFKRLATPDLPRAVWAPRGSTLESVWSVSRRYTRFSESTSERVPHTGEFPDVARAFSAHGDDEISPLTLPS